MRTLKITVVTYLAGAVAGGIGMPIIGWLISRRWNPPSVFSLSDFLISIPFSALMVAMVIAPVCLFVVAPAVHFLPPRSLLAHPICAMFSGAFVGVLSIYLWHLVTLVRRPYLPDLTADANPMFYSLALLVGAAGGVVGSLYARKKEA